MDLRTSNETKILRLLREKNKGNTSRYKHRYSEKDFFSQKIISIVDEWIFVQLNSFYTHKMKTAHRI